LLGLLWEAFLLRQNWGLKGRRPDEMYFAGREENKEVFMHWLGQNKEIRKERGWPRPTNRHSKIGKKGERYPLSPWGGGDPK